MGAIRLDTSTSNYLFKKVVKGGLYIEEKTRAGKYMFGFNGKEKINEEYGEGNFYDYGFRLYDPRIARFLSVDPLFKSYPWFTPYQFAANIPIACSDVDGMEGELRIYGDDGQILKTVTFDEPGVLGAGILYVFLHSNGDGKDNAFYGERQGAEFKILKSWHFDVSIDNVADYKSWLHVSEFTKADNSAVQKDLKKSSNGMISPVANPVITSHVGLRTDPISGEVNADHNGTDIIPGDVAKSDREGTPIIAPVDATVESVKLKTDGNGAGNRVHIRDKQGNLHSFFHLADNSIQVTKGQAIQQGATIGGMGNTGYSKGTHLHYEMHNKAGKLLDPEQENSGLKKDTEKKQ